MYREVIGSLSSRDTWCLPRFPCRRVRAPLVVTHNVGSHAVPSRSRSLLRLASAFSSSMERLSAATSTSDGFTQVRVAEHGVDAVAVDELHPRLVAQHSRDGLVLATHAGCA